MQNIEIYADRGSKRAGVIYKKNARRNLFPVPAGARFDTCKALRHVQDEELPGFTRGQSPRVSVAKVATVVEAAGGQ